MRLGIPGTLLALALLSACQTDDRTPLPGSAASATPPAIDGAKPLPSPLPAVAASVNAQPILTRNVRIVAEQAIARGAMGEDQRILAYRQATQNLIDRELLLQEATRRGLSADSEALQKAADQARVGYKDDGAWRQFLATQGMDDQTFRAELRAQHLVQALMIQVAQEIPAPLESEERAYYDANPAVFETGERFRASHILLRLEKDAKAARKAEVRALAEGVLVRVQQGESFVDLARKYSQDGDTAKKGGELPIFSKWEMVPAISEAVGALRPGQVSALLETPFGYQIFKLHERLPSLKTPFEEAREQAKQQVLAQRRQQALQALVRTLRDGAKIESYL
jgi:parvulin-like peptidyl-prolyl isomerase